MPGHEDARRRLEEAFRRMEAEGGPLGLSLQELWQEVRRLESAFAKRNAERAEAPRGEGEPVSRFPQPEPGEAEFPEVVLLQERRVVAAQREAVHEFLLRLDSEVHRLQARLDELAVVPAEQAEAAKREREALRLTTARALQARRALAQLETVYADHQRTLESLIAALADLGGS